MTAYTVYVIACGLLILIGIVIVFEALPYLNNKVHKKIAANRTYFVSRIPAYIFVRMETDDAFTANNPININVTTTMINKSETNWIQLTFDGADRYFPRPLKTPSFPSIGSPEQAWEEYKKAWEEYIKELDKMREESGANLVSLVNDTDREWTSFSGCKQNLTFSSGGKFDIGITLNKANVGVIGYEMGDRACAIKEAIEISPPEVLIQIENTNIMKGLAYIGISIPFLIAGLGGLIEILRRYALGS